MKYKWKLIKDFRNIEYLRAGNERQRMAYEDIKKYRLLEKLEKYNPVLTGTIPIAIDLPGSDLDIICECRDHSEFKACLLTHFSDQCDFKVYSVHQNGVESTIAEFRTDHFLVEIFGQRIPVEQQNSYRHMIIEDRILKEKGPHFRQKVIALKANGLKTEPAFAKLLQIDGDPFIELLKLEE